MCVHARERERESWIEMPHKEANISLESQEKKWISLDSQTTKTPVAFQKEKIRLEVIKRN